MTALLASLGLLPAAMSHAIGSDTQRPFAIVIIGGLITSTLLTMLLLPTLYKLADSWFGRKAAPAEVAGVPLLRFEGPHMRTLMTTAALMPALAFVRRTPAGGSGPAPAPTAAANGLTIGQAVSIALQREPRRHRRQDRDRRRRSWMSWRRASIPNPGVSVGVGNLVLGKANDQRARCSHSRGSSASRWQTVGVTEILDVWSKRGARTRAADRGVDQRRCLTEDALREVVYAVRSAFADAVRARARARAGAKRWPTRYAETVRLSQSRFRAGDISEAELRKIELEGMRYENAVIDGELQVGVARQHLVALLGLGPDEGLPGGKLVEPDAQPAFDLKQLTANALEHRPDLRAATVGRSAAEARLASAEREAYPDLTLGATYTHSSFTISGDNPNSLGLSLSLPLPLFDRNQANIGRARLDIRHSDNDTLRLRLIIENDVAQAVRKAQRSQALLAVFEKPGGGGGLASSATSDKGGMQERAEIALRVAEKSYKAGAISLLELLDAQRTYLDTRAQYLHARQDFRQAAIDVAHAVGE